MATEGASRANFAFDKGVSYKIDNSDRFFDALNVFINGSRLETRRGFSKYNDFIVQSSDSQKITSLSFFKKNDGTRYLVAKVGSSLYSISKTTGSHTEIKSSLDADGKHRAVTMNDRHIICVDGESSIYQWNGTTFTNLGVTVPTAPTVAASGSGKTLTASDYQVALTFYSTTTGFESNMGAASSTVTVGSGQQINVSAIPTTDPGAFIDKKRVYFRDVTNDGDWLFWDEIALATTTETIDDDASSTQTPPTDKAKPIGGAKYMTKFGRKLAYTGDSTYPSDVFVSGDDTPDGFDDTLRLGGVSRLNAPGDGPVTGIATGLYGNSVLDPFLVIFQKRSCHVFSNIGGNARFVTLSNEVGCVSHDTIKVVEGRVFFMSDRGWRVISDGSLLKESLANGDVDDIFSVSGFTYGLNKTQYSNCFSVYYSELGQYMTWVFEGSQSSSLKTWVYDTENNIFTPYSFSFSANCACVGEDANGNEVIFFGDDRGFVYTHSIREDTIDLDDIDNVDGFELDVDQLDVDSLEDFGTSPVEAFVILKWQGGSDWDASYNFRQFILETIAQTNVITLNTFLSFSRLTSYQYSYDVSGDAGDSFTLDVSRLDEAPLGDTRQRVRATQDINRAGTSILLQIYQNTESANLNLIGAQLYITDNGNQN